MQTRLKCLAIFLCFSMFFSPLPIFAAEPAKILNTDLKVVQEITILNEHSHPREGEEWKVEFTTKGKGPLFIIPNDEATIKDDKFIKLICNGKEVKPTILPGDIIYVPEWESNGINEIIHHTGKAGDHVLKFSFGSANSFAFNSTNIYKHAWAERLGGASQDYGRAVAVDSNNRVIVAGYVNGTADLNGDGDIEDTNENNAGYSSIDIFISVFESDGTFVWSERLGGTGSDYGYGVAVDSNNRIIVTGYVSGIADLNGDADTVDANESSGGVYSNYDIFISVFESDGTFAWSERLGGTGSDYGYGVAIDSNDRVVVTGIVYTTADLTGDADTSDANENNAGYGSNDIFISVFESDGTFAWSERLGGTGSDSGYGVAVDSNNRIIVTGYVSGIADLNGDADTGDANENNAGYGGNDIFISVFESDGTFTWSERLGGAGSDYGYGVAIDSNDRVVVAGFVYATADLTGDADTSDANESGGGVYGSGDVFVSVFESDGTFAWSERLGGTSNDYGYGVAIDSNNKIIVTGVLQGSSDLTGDADIDDENESGTGYGNYDVFVSVFDSDGTFAWSERLGAVGDDSGYGVAADSNNRIIVIGYIYSTADLTGDADTDDANESSGGVYGTTYDVFLTAFDRRTVTVGLKSGVGFRRNVYVSTES